jgi:hypothetical protein
MTASAVLAKSAFARAAGPYTAGLSEGSPAPDPKLLERARALLKKAPFIDTHNDLPSMFLETKAGDLKSFDMSQVQPTLCADVPRLREGCVGAQYWSVFVESGRRSRTPLCMRRCASSMWR